MKLKVCHLTSVHQHLDTRIFFKECKSLAEVGYHVTLIALKDQGMNIDHEGIEFIPFTRYKNRLRRIFFSPFKMYSMARNQKADIYHFHDPELLVTGLLLRLFTRSKVIYDIHEDHAKNFIDREWIRFKILRWVVSKLFFYFELLVCRLMSGNIVVLPPWLKKYPKAVLVRNYPLLEKKEGEKDKNLFVYVGTIGSKRCALEMILIFVELMKLLPDIKFKIIGNFFEKNVESAVMSYVNRFPNIDYLGFRPFSEAKKTLFKSKYGFVLYAGIKYQENIPVKMYEYLANEVITIFSSFEDFKYDIENEGWGIGVNPNNPKAAARKIHDIIIDKEKIRTIEENIKKYKTKYSWESEKKELIDLYFVLTVPGQHQPLSSTLKKGLK
jgi:glycosyltransferase involved in cell wall biosynthesis